MPFTPAHPAIVLPFLNRKYFSATGLIMGSVSPDFEYFIKASIQGVHGHTLAGIFYFDIPIALFFALVFHLWVKESFLSNLPAFLQVRLQPFRSLDFRNYMRSHYVIFFLSVVLGAASHIFWDSFTHNGTYFVQNMSIYQSTFVPFQGVKYPLWYALQHISTFTGLAIIVGYIAWLPQDDSIQPSSPKIGYWLALIALGGLFFLIRFTLFTVKFNLGNVVVTSISSLILALCLLSRIPYFKPVSVRS
jgi:hypothetical protein